MVLVTNTTHCVNVKSLSGRGSALRIGEKAVFISK